MQGCGNDFILLDFLHGDAPSFRQSEVRWACDRHFGLGADGLVILQPSSVAQAGWKFYNRDGSLAEMCGNAARCVILYLSQRHFPGEAVITLETEAGVIRGRLLGDGRVEVTMPCPSLDEYQDKVLRAGDQIFHTYCVNTGVPHAVLEVQDLATYPVSHIGSEILRHAAFEPHQTNVTFFQRLVGARILSTTFERGVERETLACGTGAVAAARIFSELYQRPFPVEVQVPGGLLTVDKTAETFLLQGPAESVWEVTAENWPRDFDPPHPFSDRKGKR
jgi:diaminopimelate epimerase